MNILKKYYKIFFCNMSTLYYWLLISTNFMCMRIEEMVYHQRSFIVASPFVGMTLGFVAMIAIESYKNWRSERSKLVNIVNLQTSFPSPALWQNISSLLTIVLATVLFKSAFGHSPPARSAIVTMVLISTSAIAFCIASCEVISRVTNKLSR